MLRRIGSFQIKASSVMEENLPLYGIILRLFCFSEDDASGNKQTSYSVEYCFLQDCVWLWRLLKVRV